MKEAGLAHNPSGPLIVQRDGSLLLEVDSPLYDEARGALARFAELVKTPGLVHTYRLTPLSLWNAAAAGMGAGSILEALERYSRYGLPAEVREMVIDHLARYGHFLLRQAGGDLLLSGDASLLSQLSSSKTLGPLIGDYGPEGLLLNPGARGAVKQALFKAG